MALEAYASGKRDEVHTDVLFQARQACYKARDAFYSCLENHSDKKPTEIGSVGLLYPTECKRFREEYVKNCRVSWVKHFDRQYCKTKRTQRLLDDKETRRGSVTGSGSASTMRVSVTHHAADEAAFWLQQGLDSCLK